MPSKPKLQLLAPPFAYKAEFSLKDLKEQELVDYKVRRRDTYVYSVTELTVMLFSDWIETSSPPSSL